MSDKDMVAAVKEMAKESAEGKIAAGVIEGAFNYGTKPVSHEEAATMIRTVSRKLKDFAEKLERS